MFATSLSYSFPDVYILAIVFAIHLIQDSEQTRT